MRNRVLLALQDGGLYGHAVQLYCGADGAKARRHEAERHVAAPPDDKIQRRVVYCAARGCGGVHRRGAAGYGRGHCILPRQRGNDRGGAE